MVWLYIQVDIKGDIVTGNNGWPVGRSEVDQYVYVVLSETEILITRVIKKTKTHSSKLDSNPKYVLAIFDSRSYRGNMKHINCINLQFIGHIVHVCLTPTDKPV